MKNEKKVMLLLALGAMLITGCDHMVSKKKTTQSPKDRETRSFEKTGSLLGAEGLVFGGSNSSSSKGAIPSSNALNVNIYLWRASLECLNFMPLASVDANGGVIVTDWYASAQKPTERLKVVVEIRSSQLRVNALKVTVHKQLLKNMQWVNDTMSDESTAAELESIILTKARKFKMHAVA